MSDTVFLVLVLIGLLAAALIIPHMLLRAAVPRAIKILREHGAVDAENAVSIQGAGLAPQTLWERAFRRRDYKAKALMSLIQLDIVQLRDDGKVYLSEIALATSIFRGS